MLNQTYATAYATYAVCMKAYAWGITFLVDFPLYSLFCIQKKKRYSAESVGSVAASPLRRSSPRTPEGLGEH